VVIDAHLHIGLNNWSEKSLLDNLDRRGIDKAWILTWDEKDPVLPSYYIPLDIQSVAKAFKNHPDRIVPFYAPDPARENWKELLSARLDEGFAGCGELKVPYRWNDPVMQPLLEFLDQHSLPLVFHMEQARKVFSPSRDHGWDWLFKRLINERFNGRSAHFILQLQSRTGIGKHYFERKLRDFPGYLLDFDELEKTLQTYRSIRFVAHGPHFWNHFSIPLKPYLFLQEGKMNGTGRIWQLLNKHNNLYCDLSGYSGFYAMNRDHDASRTFLDKFHSKILFGTDNTSFGLTELIHKLVPSGEKRERILYGNAEALSGI